MSISSSIVLKRNISGSSTTLRVVVLTVNNLRTLSNLCQEVIFLQRLNGIVFTMDKVGNSYQGAASNAELGY